MRATPILPPTVVVQTAQPASPVRSKAAERVRIVRRIGGVVFLLGMMACLGGLGSPEGPERAKMMETAGACWFYGVLIFLGGWVASWFVD